MHGLKVQAYKEVEPMSNDARGDQKSKGQQDPDPLAAIVRRGPDNAGELDVSMLSEEQQNALVVDYQQGLIDIRLRAATLGVDVTVLGETLRQMSEQTQAISETDASVTITHTQDSSLGRTEIIMGNTEQAHRGRLTRSQGGDRDWTPFYVIGGLIVLAIALVAFFGR